MKTKTRFKRNTIKIKYPSALPDSINSTAKEFEKEAVMAMAVKMFEMNKISSGIAATIAGTDRVSFLLSLHKYNVPYFETEKEEIISDLKNA